MRRKNSHLLLDYMGPKYMRSKDTSPKTAGSKEDGYSLLEILVVLAIIGMLATLVAPRLFAQLDRGKITATEAQARNLQTALDAFRLDVGRYPTEQEGLASLLNAPQELDGRWQGPYMEGGEIPRDQWANDFVYHPPLLDANGRPLRPKIISYGADGVEGGSGNDADIGS